MTSKEELEVSISARQTIVWITLLAGRTGLHTIDTLTIVIDINRRLAEHALRDATFVLQ